MIKIAVCDDNTLFLSQIKSCLEQWNSGGEPLLITTFTDGDALIQTHGADPFDIIFLDVVMPLLNGISAAGEIRETDRLVKIVFLTSSPEYALDSYRVKASDYLLKPVRQEALFHTMDELFRELRRETRSIALRTPGAVYRVELDKIEYMEAQNKRVLFALTDGRTMVSVDPLYFYEQKLTPQDGFFKCNRSYIVNIHRIDSFSPKEARMRSGARIPISRSCHREFEAAYFSAIFGKAGDF